MKSRTIFLIQLFLWLSCILGCVLPTAQAALAPNQEIQAVQSLEDTLFAVHYDQDALNDRVSRLEETVFGQAQTGANIDARITRLQGSLSPKALGPLSPIAKNSGNTQPSANSGANKGNGPSDNSVNQQRNTPMATNSNTLPQQVASNSGTSTSGKNRFNRQSAVKAPNSTSAKSAANPANSSVSASPEPGETDYPTVSQMETKLFGKTFPKEDITQRLSRLENQVFKMPQTGSLADRTDNLRMVVLGDVGQGQGQPVANGYQSDPQYPVGSSYGYPQPPNYSGYNGMGGSSSSGYGGSNPYGNSAYSPPGNYPSTPIASAGSTAGGMNPMPGYGRPGNTAYQPKDSANATTPDMLAAMNEVEKEVLGTTYPAEPINTRLDRLENKVFKTTSPDMSPQDRMQRVIAVASAGGAPMTNKAKVKSTFQVLLPIILTILPLVLL